MDWPKLKQGYSELVNLYGATNLKSNRLAYMSFVAADKSSAKSAFASVGSDWHPHVWRSAENFAAAKNGRSARGFTLSLAVICAC
jgi:hypothetical protein